MTSWEMLQQPSFYLIYVMMTLVAFGGLVVTSQLKAIASFYKVDKVIIAWGMTAAILAIQLNRILNGVTRPLWGWISDHIGRENAMFTAFLIEGIAVFALAPDDRPAGDVRLVVGPVCSSPGARFSRCSPRSRRSVWQDMGHDELWRRLYRQGYGRDLCRSGRCLT